MAPRKKISTTLDVSKGRGRGAVRGPKRGGGRGKTAQVAPVIGQPNDANHIPPPDQRSEEENHVHRTQYSEDEALLANFPKAVQDAVRGALHKRDIDAWKAQRDAERQSRQLNREQEVNSHEPIIPEEGNPNPQSPEQRQPENPPPNDDRITVVVASSAHGASQAIPDRSNEGRSHAATLTPEEFDMILRARANQDIDQGYADPCIGIYDKSPFSRAIATTEIPLRFPTPKIPRYDGKSDPEAHIQSFAMALIGRRATDALQCVLFPATLKDSAAEWFLALPDGSIRNFDQLRRAFLSRYAGIKKAPRDKEYLLNLRQGTNQTIREWHEYFFKEATDVQNITVADTLFAFQWGTTNIPFREKLVSKPPATLEELAIKIERFGKIEDLRARTRSETKQWSGETKRGMAKGREGERERKTYRNFPQQTPLNAPIATVLSEIDRLGLAERPVVNQGESLGREENQYCDFHRSRGHDTSKCRQLRFVIEKLIHEGHLRQFVRRDLKDAGQRGYTRSPSRRSFERSNSPRRGSHQPRSPHRRFQRSRSPPPRHARRSSSRGIHVKVAHQGHLNEQDERPKGVINVISGGHINRPVNPTERPALAFLAGHKRSYIQEEKLFFSEADTSHITGPSGDALTITARVASYDVKKILIDSGSSADIMFWNTFERLQIPRHQLEPVANPLVGFTGDMVVPVGVISLSVSLGTKPARITRQVQFLVVNLTSPYNIILGRPTLNAMRAVASTYHMKLKFPTDYGIGEVKGNQETPEEREERIVLIRRKKQLATKAKQAIEPLDSENKLSTTMTIEADPRDDTYRPSPVEELELINVGKGTVKIGSCLPP